MAVHQVSNVFARTPQNQPRTNRGPANYPLNVAFGGHNWQWEKSFASINVTASSTSESGGMRIGGLFAPASLLMRYVGSDRFGDPPVLETGIGVVSDSLEGLQTACKNFASRPEP